VIGRLERAGDLAIDTWLMSCRVLGRGVEEATLDLVVAASRRLGASRLIGEYRPTAKNAMVAQHYPKLGFGAFEEAPGASRYVLALENFAPPELFMTVGEASG